ncbi:hypothetical protein LCGC14_0298160 [marine sediment metagenome]|uniref:Uncharacterized protein n=1 Tax=marine sediment metagenome TaxID=412755 RepID=A0A0F9U893_9ZZZZ
MKKILLEDAEGDPCFIGHTDPCGFAREQYVFVQVGGKVGWFTAKGAREFAKTIEEAAKELEVGK